MTTMTYGVQQEINIIFHALMVRTTPSFDTMEI